MLAMTIAFIVRTTFNTAINGQLAYVDAVPTQFLISGFERYGSRRMFVSSRVFVVALQTIANF